VVDMNGDNMADIVFAATHIDGSYPNPGFAGVILQNSTVPGTFQASLNTVVGANPSTLAVGNLDSASGADVVVANANSANISVLLHDPAIPNAQLMAANNIAIGGVPYDVAVGDLNGDGLPDIAVANAGTSNTASVLMRNPASPGNFLPATTLAVGNPSTSVAIGDLNGDSRADLIVANVASGGIGRVTIFFQSAVTPGTFSGRSDIAAGTEPLSVKIGDLNNDGRNDIAVANEGAGSSGSGTAGVSVLLQSASNAGTFSPAVTYATARGSVCVAIGDLNNDGLRDLAVANTGGSRTGTLSVLLQDVSHPGSFLSATNYPGINQPLGVAIGNLNSDFFADIVVADGSRATVMFNSATTPGAFAAAVSVGR
jgi:FG-GAP-like repeat